MSSVDGGGEAADVASAERSGTGSTHDRRDWLSGSPWSRVDGVVASGLGLVVMAIAYVFRSVVTPTDPWHYVKSALSFPSDGWVPLGYTRYGIILATKPVAHVFGDAQVTYYFWPIFSAGLLAAAVYLLGRRWWGWPGGGLAVILLFSNAVVFYNLSRGYPDIMSMALFCLAIVLALRARDARLAGRRDVLWLLAVGFLLGWGFEVRETSMLAWPLIGVILWRRGTILRTAALVAMPLVFWAAVDVGISAWAYGDPLLKLHTLSGLDIAPGEAGGVSSHAALIGQPRWFYFAVIPRAAWAAVGGFWMITLGALALLGLLVRDKVVRLFVGWFVGVYTLTVLAAGGLDPAHPGGSLDVARYWIPFFPAISIVVGALVVIVGRKLGQRIRKTSPRLPRGRVIPTLVLAALVSFGPVSFAAQYATSYIGFAPNGGSALEDLRDHLRGSGPTTGRVWTDWETARILPIYQRDFFGGKKVWTGSVKTLTGEGEPVPGDRVLLFSARSSTCTFCRDALRPWLLKHPQVPSTWTKEYVADKGNLTLYTVG